MTKGETELFVQKINSGVEVYAVSGNTKPDSDLGYRWEYRLDSDIDEFGDEIYFLEFRHCGNGKGCFEVAERYEYLTEADAYQELQSIAIHAGAGDIIEFTDGTQMTIH